MGGGGKGEGGRRGLPSAVATVVGMNDMTTLHDAIGDFPRRKAQTLRFSCGAPRSATAIGDGSRVLFLRSDGPEDLVTSLWLSVFDADGTHREVLLADPRVLLADADDEDVMEILDFGTFCFQLLRSIKSNIRLIIIQDRGPLFAVAASGGCRQWNAILR